MTSLKRSFVFALTLFGFVAAGATAKADPLTLTLTMPYQSVTAGNSVVFSASLFNNSAQTIYLNSDSSTVPQPLSIDDSFFVNDYPLSLNAGASYSGQMFTVTVPLGTPSALYAGSFQILGGSSANAFDQVASANFNLNLGTSASVSPEPSSVRLLGSGLAMLSGLLLTGVRSRQR